MPTQLLNHTLSRISDGVTQQYQEGRFESQVSQMINCIPSITRGVLRRNPIRPVENLSELPNDLCDAFTYAYDRGNGNEQYLVVIPGDGSIFTYNINDGQRIQVDYTSSVDYLKVPAGKKAREEFAAITIGDHTFIVNKTITTRFSNKKADTAGYTDMAFYWVKKTTLVVSKQEQTDPQGTPPVVKTGSLSYGYEYEVNQCRIKATLDSRPNSTAVNMSTAFEIAAEFKAKSTTSKLDKNERAFVFSTNYTESTFDWEDTFGNQASLGVWKNVDDANKLPAKLPQALDGFVVRVSGGTTSKYDDYFLKYDYSIESWKEVPGIHEDGTGVLVELDASTMPHVLYRKSDGAFLFDVYKDLNTGESKWLERTSGGLDKNQDPSFIGYPIVDIFFHKNRLGFLTSDSVILSQNGEYGNFFEQTIQDVLADDPIDIAVATTDVTVLRHAVPTSGQLILFADDSQLSLDSTDGPLTPHSADIALLSNYTYGDKAKATAIGNRVFFTNQAGGYSQLYAYKAGARNTKLSNAYPLTLHVPSYIADNTKSIVGHDVLGQIFILDCTLRTGFTVLTTTVRGDEELQNAFHRWEFAEEVVNVFVVNNSLYILFNNKDLTVMNLEIPGNIATIDYTDKYVSKDATYLSGIYFSEFFLRDGKGKGTNRGRFQIRTVKYTLGDSSFYETVIRDKVLTNVTYPRVYRNDEKITVMSNSKTLDMVFSTNEDYPNKGFELATVNIEAQFTQRSSRV